MLSVLDPGKFVTLIDTARIFGEDSGLREEKVYWSAPDPPRSPESPRSFRQRVHHRGACTPPLSGVTIAGPMRARQDSHRPRSLAAWAPGRSSGSWCQYRCSCRSRAGRNSFPPGSEPEPRAASRRSTDRRGHSACSWRASDAEREQTVALLQRGFADGRLTKAELAERAGAAYAARTRAELRGLTADLPAARTARNTRPGPWPARTPRPSRAATAHHRTPGPRAAPHGGHRRAAARRPPGRAPDRRQRTRGEATRWPSHRARSWSFSQSGACARSIACVLVSSWPVRRA